MEPFLALTSLSLPFIVRSPDSIRHEQPSWWTGKLTGKWVGEAYYHVKREMYLGSGETFEEALADLPDGMHRTDPDLNVDLRLPQHERRT